MLFAIHALDRPDYVERRLAPYDAHKAFLLTAGDYGVNIVLGGSLVDDDGAMMIGSLLVVEAADRAALERFNAADPYARNGICEKVTIKGFVRRQG